MEADGPVSEIICVSDSINPEEIFIKDNETDKQIRLSEGDNVKMPDNQDEDNKAHNNQNKQLAISEEGGYNDEDDEAIIVETEPNQPIDVDEEIVAFDETSVEHTDDTLLQSAKPTNDTELVIIKATNNTSINCVDENETIDRFPLDIQIKDELAEPITDVCPNDVLENDPMGLLEPNDRSEITSSSRSQGDPDEYGDDLSSSSSVKTGSSTTNVVEWSKDYPWLLYEEGEDINGYCLYCDTNLNIKSHSYIKQHGLSLYHKERCDNYLAFRDEELRNGLSSTLVEIKQEFGTDSRVVALKLKRKTQIEALSNFNWRRWLEECSWLERISSEGTAGRCKYCRIRLNVEFSYLRVKHKESVKHKDSEKNYKEESNGQNSNANTINDIGDDKEQEIDSASNNSEKWREIVKDRPNLIICKPCNSKMIKTSYAKHLRSNLHAHNVNNYPKNSNKRRNSSVTKDELDALRIKQWKTYAKKHPWMMADPIDSKFAFCKYCEKRVIYGNSVAKRATHENSSQHKNNETSFRERQRKSNDDGEPNQDEQIKENDDNNGVANSEDEDDGEEDKCEEDEGEEQNEEEDDEDNDVHEENELEEEETNDDEEEVDDESDQETEENDNIDSKKRIYRLSEEWFNQYPWSKKHKNDSSSIYCIYCKIPLSVSYNRAKHQATALHVAAEAEYLNKQSKKQQTQDKRHELNESYEWAVTLKNNPNMYSCKYCNVTISKKCSKKNHGSSKIHQINENIYKTNRRKSSRQEGNSTINCSQTSTTVTQPSVNSSLGKVQRYAKVIVKTPSVVTLIKNWQKKFTWLSYKRNEIRSNYGYCKICENSLFIRSLKHVIRHTRSIKHVRSCRLIRKQKIEQEQEQEKESASKNVLEKGPKDEVNESPMPSLEMKPKKQIEENTTPTTTTTAGYFSKEINYKSTIEELQKRFSWIEKSSRPKLAFCRYCNSHIPIKVLFLRNHSNSGKHRQSVINFCKTSKKIDKMSTETDSPEKANDNDNENDKDDDGDGKNDDDVMAVEENTEEILISEQDENWDVKSETMDEHEELDYLLQRSINNIKNKRNSHRNVRNSLNTDEQPTKRIKRSQSFRRLNESNSSLVASLLSTPLTLASCIGPILQQQIQQATNAQLSSVQASPVQTAVPVEAENTYDLFFKSISETMKKLPVDLAAEGKVKVMQIICDLELQALKRQQPSICETPFSNLSGIIYTPTPTSTNVAIASAVPTGTGNVDGAGGGGANGITEQNALFGETLVTSYYSNANLSSPTASSRTTYVAPTPPPPTPPIPTLPAHVDTEKVPSSASPVIGVMDKNGLQTLQLKSSMAKQQHTKSTSATKVTTASNNSGLRCIPFKNLTQTQMAGDVNSKFTRIHVPLSTSQTPISNTTPTSNPKGMLNFRNIQITKRAAPHTSAPSPSGVTTVTLASTNSQLQTTMVNNSPQRTYFTNIQPQLQRWGCSVNGASPNTPISSASCNNQLSMKQTSTPIIKKN